MAINDDYADWGYNSGGGSALTNVGQSMGSDWDEWGNYVGGEPGGSTGFTDDSDNWDLQGNRTSYPDQTPVSQTTATGTTAATTATGTKATATGKTGDGKDADWGAALNKLLSTGSGLFDLLNKNSRLSMTGITEDATSLADPLRKDRPFYGGMLRSLMTDPTSYNLSAPAQFELAQGTENLSRAGAARGLLGSGNLMGEIMKYGQGVASQDYWKQVENLGRLSGGTTGNPAAAGNIYGNLYGMRNNAAANIGGGTSGGRTVATTATGTGSGTSTGGKTSTSGGNTIDEWGNVIKAGGQVVSAGKDLWTGISSLFK